MGSNKLCFCLCGSKTGNASWGNGMVGMFRNSLRSKTQGLYIVESDVCIWI